VLIANSKATAAQYQGWFSERQKLYVVYNGIDLGEFVPIDSTDGQIRSESGISDNALVLGVIGRITPNKGQDVFLQALAKVKEVVPNVYGLIVGDVMPDADGVVRAGSYMADLRRLASELGLCDRVQFLGAMEQVSKIYSCLDVLVVPSRREPFGRVLLEALAMKKPVVATNVGGIPEVIEDGVTGLLVSEDDPDALAEAIVRLITDSDLYNRIAVNGKRFVEKFFSIESHAAAIERIYLEELARRGKRHRWAW
jgi:glycosyltransferase involved in cell wall biosynthesis